MLSFSQTFCTSLGAEEANRQLRIHWKTWVNEDHIKYDNIYIYEKYPQPLPINIEAFIINISSYSIVSYFVMFLYHIKYIHNASHYVV